MKISQKVISVFCLGCVILSLIYPTTIAKAAINQDVSETKNRVIEVLKPMYHDSKDNFQILTTDNRDVTTDFFNKTVALAKSENWDSIYRYIVDNSFIVVFSEIYDTMPMSDYDITRIQRDTVIYPEFTAEHLGNTYYNNTIEYEFVMSITFNQNTGYISSAKFYNDNYRLFPSTLKYDLPIYYNVLYNSSRTSATFTVYHNFYLALVVDIPIMSGKTSRTMYSVN